MRVDEFGERDNVRVDKLEYGQCFRSGDDVFVLSDYHRYDETRLKGTLMAVRLESGAAMWFDEDTEVRPLYAKVVVEW